MKMQKFFRIVLIVTLVNAAITLVATMEDEHDNEPVHQAEIAVICDTVVISDSLVIVNCSNWTDITSTSYKWPYIDDRVTTLDFSNLKLKNSKMITNVNNLKNLVHFNISNNMLFEVDSLSIHSLENLKHVDFSKNMLKKIPACIRGIESMKLDANRIDQLHIHKDIGQCANLKKLTLTHNSIDLVNSLCLSEYSSILETLDLSSNEIKRIEPCSFEKLNNLMYLNLSHNYLFQVKEGDFKTLESLEKLDLSYNLLEQVDMNIFQSLDSLKFLDVSHNLLKVLPNILPMLDWFDASFNKISTLPETYTTVLYPQAVFLLGGNPFVCNCDLLWLKEFFDTRKYLLKFLKDIDTTKFIPSCDSPDSIKGIPWVELDNDKFHCEGIEDMDTSVVKDNVEQVLKGKDLVEATEIGKHSIILIWKIPADLCKSIEIRYHRFGHKKDSKEIVLPSSVSNYRLKKLHSGTPYVICVKITLTNDLQDCIEVVTESEDIDQSIISNNGRIFQSIFNTCYSRFDVIVLTIGLFTILYFVFLRDKDE